MRGLNKVLPIDSQKAPASSDKPKIRENFCVDVDKAATRVAAKKKRQTLPVTARPMLAGFARQRSCGMDQPLGRGRAVVLDGVFNSRAGHELGHTLRSVC